VMPTPRAHELVISSVITAMMPTAQRMRFVTCAPLPGDPPGSAGMFAR
jgi:hypothetical protein